MSLLLVATCLTTLLGCEEPPAFSGEGGILDSPIGVAIHGDYAYVTNANFDLSGDKEGWIAVVDIPLSLRNRKTCIINRVFTDPFLGEIIIDQAGAVAYVANRKRDEVWLFDLSDPIRPEPIDLNEQAAGVQGIKVGIEPVGMALSPDETLLFVANVRSGDLSIVDVLDLRLIKNERLGSGINAVAVDPQGRYAYVTNKGVNSIAMLDIETGSFVTSFSVGDPRTGLGQDTRGIAFSADGRYIYIATRDPASLMVVDADKLPHYPDRAVVEYIPMDSKPTAVEISPDGSEIWVANFNSSNVYVVDAMYHNILDVVEVGVGPYDIAFSNEIPDGSGHHFAYITNFFSHNISLIDATSKDYVWAIP